MITKQQAYDMGAKGGPVVEAERELFEEWMRGHCWAVSGTWNGATYIGSNEGRNSYDPHAALTRQVWATWRDRAALAAADAATEEKDHFQDMIDIDGNLYGIDFLRVAVKDAQTYRNLKAAHEAAPPLRDTLFALIEAVDELVGGEDHALSGGMRREYAEGSLTALRWQAVRDSVKLAAAAVKAE